MHPLESTSSNLFTIIMMEYDGVQQLVFFFLNSVRLEGASVHAWPRVEVCRGRFHFFGSAGWMNLGETSSRHGSMRAETS